MIRDECPNFTNLEQAIISPFNSKTIPDKIKVLNNCTLLCGKIKSCCCNIISNFRDSNFK